MLTPGDNPGGHGGDVVVGYPPVPLEIEDWEVLVCFEDVVFVERRVLEDAVISLEL